VQTSSRYKENIKMSEDKKTEKGIISVNWEVDNDGVITKESEQINDVKTASNLILGLNQKSDGGRALNSEAILFLEDIIVVNPEFPEAAIPDSAILKVETNDHTLEMVISDMILFYSLESSLTTHKEKTGSFVTGKFSRVPVEVAEEENASE
jgi:hypothetical protein